MAVNFFLKLQDIAGEAKDTGFEGQIKLHSWSWGSSNTASFGTTAGGSGGTVSLSDISIMKDYDKASPVLFQKICTGKTIDSGVITAVKSTGDTKPATFLTYTLTNIYVTSQQHSASSEIPMESLSLAFEQVAVEYFAQDDASGQLTSTGAVTFNLSTKLQS